MVDDLVKRGVRIQFDSTDKPTAAALAASASVPSAAAAVSPASTPTPAAAAEAEEKGCGMLDCLPHAEHYVLEWESDNLRVLGSALSKLAATEVLSLALPGIPSHPTQLPPSTNPSNHFLLLRQ